MLIGDLLKENGYNGQETRRQALGTSVGYVRQHRQNIERRFSQRTENSYADNDNRKDLGFFLEEKKFYCHI